MVLLVLLVLFVCASGKAPFKQSAFIGVVYLLNEWISI